MTDSPAVATKPKAVQNYSLRESRITVNYAEDKDRLLMFFKFFMDDEASTTEPKYISQLKEGKKINLLLENLVDYGLGDIAQKFIENTKTYIYLAYEAVDELIYDSDLAEIFNSTSNTNTFDVFTRQRIERFKSKFPEASISQFMGFLIRSYTITVNTHSLTSTAIRFVKADSIGRLVKVRGIVTKTTKIKPSIRVATYLCEYCGAETFTQIPSASDSFDLLEECTSDKCKSRKVKGTLVLISRGSKYQKFQNIQIQELQSDVPHGCIPRSISIECFDSTVDMCRPGEEVTITGVFMPRTYHGFKKIKAGLLNDTFIEALSVISAKGESGAMSDYDISSSYNHQTILSLFAPEIYGMADVKKIIMLMLISAPQLSNEDGIKIRGDINVLLLGEPGIAKSQLLKTVSRISRRGVYATGKGASGVGLTACITKDPVTGEIALEGGALVLADKGVCCIDELDKMSDHDRVSIHEAMEQQSISVSRAGINTTLNARCSLLAAANPIRGKYNSKKSIEWNVGLPSSLISRFDSVIILKDEMGFDDDFSLAAHVTSFHEAATTTPENSEDVEDANGHLSMKDHGVDEDTTGILRSYIEKARAVKCSITEGLKSKLVNSYIKAREISQITPRYLLALIRFSQAHARLRLSEVVNEEDVDEAIRLMRLSERNLRSENRTAESGFVSTKHIIYNFIVNCCENLGGSVAISELVSMSSYSEADIRMVVKEFEEAGVFFVSNDVVELV